MRCVDARTRFAELHDGTGTVSVRRQIEAHLAACPRCAREWHWAESLLGEFARLRATETPAVDVADRVMRQVATLPIPTASRMAFGGVWPWAAAAAAALLALLAGTAWALGPSWIAETARIGGRLVAKTAATLPTWLATADALLRALAGVARVLLPGPGLVERSQPLLLGAAYFFCAAFLAASVVLAGREWRSARRRTGAGS